LSNEPAEGAAPSGAPTTAKNDLSTPAETKPSKWPPEALLLALIPLCGYCITFLYEKGFCDRFGVPSELIAPAPIQIFTAVGVLIGASLLGFIGVLAGAWLGFWLPRSGRFLAPLPAIAAYLWIEVAAAGNSLTSRYVWYGALLCYFAVLAVIWKWDTSRKPLAGFSRPRFWLVAGSMSLVFAFMVSLWVAYFAGNRSCLQRVRYLVLDGSPPRVVLRIYGDHLIVAPFDPRSKQVTPEFSILTLESGFKETLKLRPVGPLSPSK
jgi:hypothetical protein